VWLRCADRCQDEVLDELRELAWPLDGDLVPAVEELEPDLRDVVKHCYLKQMSYREVSAALNVCTSTIGTRLMRARARLRELLISRTRDVVKP